ncbi:MAG: hypothetical protein U1G08_12755 [Verrucomicrobiota bacterium]
MNITGLRILPPFAIARLGSADQPLHNFSLTEDPDRPLDFRRLQAAETFHVDESTGEIRSRSIPKEITFKDASGRIRPVAPFLEVFAETPDGLVPLTSSLLKSAGLKVADLAWRVEVGNRKVARRTGVEDDQVQADTGWFSGHDSQELLGHSRNFISTKAAIRFGRVRFLRPNADFPEIRFRFHPAPGQIYGPRLTYSQWRQDQEQGGKLVSNLYQIPQKEEFEAALEQAQNSGRFGTPPDPEKVYESLFPNPFAVYNPTKGWYEFEVPSGIDNMDPYYNGRFVSETLPPSLYGIKPPGPCWLNNNVAISRGFYDDACDGIVTVRLRRSGRPALEARARVTSGPPMVIPDTLFLRTLADDLDQVIHGPWKSDQEPAELTRARALDVIRRAFETVRFLNVAVMNGNQVQGRDPLLFDTMPTEEAFDTERLMRPVVPERTADTLMIQALHQQVFVALQAGTAPWFFRMLRLPNEVGDYTDHGRRKMPAMMCGADGSYLALSWRQIEAIRHAATLGPGPASKLGEAGPVGDPLWSETLTPRNLSAQLHYAAQGNPVSSRPVTSIANCTPGLEVDFRAVWRRIFKGLVLREWDNLVVDVEKGARDADGKSLAHLKGCRLMRVEGHLMMTQMTGPSPADPDTESVVLATDANPHGVAPLEWSNALAKVLREPDGNFRRSATCDLTPEPVWLNQAWWHDGATAFCPDDVLKGNAFRQRLEAARKPNAKDRAAAFIVQHLDQELKALESEPKDDPAPTSAATPLTWSATVVEGLNRLLSSPEQPLQRAAARRGPSNPFNGRLSDETRKLLAEKPEKDQRLRLGRMIVEDVFPEVLARSRTTPHETVRLELRHFFEPHTAVISRELAGPGELTQGLCSPWQNDYRECSCYYWASARPDYVNVEPTPSGTSRGDNWMQKDRTGQYIADDYADDRLLMYDDLFYEWERWLKIQVRGRDTGTEAHPLATAHPQPAAGSGKQIRKARRKP